ncbi:MAG: 50S ribosomal protein L11 methyltransferase [Eubacteriales bacterium]|nr:50S ribosomal protein L11 methyltransferase [Clostridia bacterium]
MDWTEISIKTSQEGADIAAQAFYEVGITGLVIEDPDELSQLSKEEFFWDYIDESMVGTSDGTVVIKAYLSSDSSLGEKLSLIKDKINWLKNRDLGVDLGSLDIELTSVREEDWSNTWKKYYKPMKVSDRIVIKPSWETYNKKKGQVILTLDPGMAFGTGTHETTMLCMQAIDQYIRPDHSLIDIGCGTGVLSIGALLLGAKAATAIDLDGNAVEIARKNAQINKVLDRMTLVHGNLLDEIEGSYDIVVANIIADVIIELSQYVTNYIKAGGLFISSGIIHERLDEVIEQIESVGLIIEKVAKMGEWAMVVSRYNG